MSVQRRFLVLAFACALIAFVCASIGTAVMRRLPQVAAPWMQLGGVMIVLASVITAIVALWHVFSAVSALLRLARVGGKHAIPTTQAALALTALEYWCAPWVRRIAIGGVAVGMSAAGISACLPSQAMAAALFESPSQAVALASADEADAQPGDDLGWSPSPDPSIEPGDSHDPIQPEPQAPTPGSSQSPDEEPNPEGMEGEASDTSDAPSGEGSSIPTAGDGDQSLDSARVGGVGASDDTDPSGSIEAGDTGSSGESSQDTSDSPAALGASGAGESAASGGSGEAIRHGQSHTLKDSSGISRSQARPHNGVTPPMFSQPPISDLGWMSTETLGGYPSQWSPASLSQYTQHRFSLNTGPSSRTDSTTHTSPTRDEQERISVAEGDCLWDLTARYLEATSHSDTDIHLVASQWPLLYDSNREVIGSDPSLIFPGTALVIPEQWRN